MAGIEAIPDLSIEGQNPSRRYKWFRPRQAFRQTYALSPTNLGSIALYNAGSTVYLVVRALGFNSGGSNTLYSFYQPGIYGTFAAAGQALVYGQPPGSGSLYYNDTSSTPTADFYFILNAGPGILFPPFPFAVVPPNTSYVITNEEDSAFTGVSFYWEEIRVEELDYFYSLL